MFGEECFPPPTDSLDAVCMEHWTYGVLRDLYVQGYLNATAGELVIGKELTRYEMALITANVAKEVIRRIDEAPGVPTIPDRVFVMIGDLARYYGPELKLLGLDEPQLFAEYGLYDPEPAVSEETEDQGEERFVEGGDFDLDFPSLGEWDDEEFTGTLDGLDDFEFDFDSSLDDFLGGLEAVLGELPPNEDVDEPIETSITPSGQIVGGTSITINGGTSIEFLRRVVAGKPYELDDDEKKVYIEPEEYLRQSLWFSLTGRPNDNVELTARIEGENREGLMTDMSSLSIGAMSLLAQTKHTEIWIGTLQRGIKLDEEAEGRSEGIRITYNGEKITVAGTASITRQVKENPDDDVLYYSRYNIGANVNAHSLVENWEFGLGVTARWDDPFSTPYSATPPSRLLSGRFTTEGLIGETSVSALLELQGYEEDTTKVLPEWETNLAAGVSLAHDFGNLSLRGSAYYVGDSYQPEDGKDGTTGGAGEWRTGEYGVDASASYSMLDGRMRVSGTAGYGVRAIPETRKVNDDEEITEYILHYQNTAGITGSYRTDIVINEESYGTFNISNRLNYTFREREDNPDIWRQDVTNVTSVGLNVEPVDGWNNDVSASFTLSNGEESDETATITPIEKRMLAFGYTTTYTWVPKDGLSFTPRYSFSFDRDFGVEPVHATKHQASLSMNSELVPSVLVVTASGQIGLDTVLQTTFDDDGEPIYGRSNFAVHAELGARYTPDWFEGFALTGSVGKRNVTYIEDDIISTGATVKPTQDSWIFQVGANYRGFIGDFAEWNTYYNFARTMDDVEEYDDTVHRAGVNGVLKIGEVVNVRGSYDMSVAKKQDTHTASVGITTDLGPNTEFGVSWNRRVTYNNTDPTGDSDELVDELRAFFSGTF